MGRDSSSWVQLLLAMLLGALLLVAALGGWLLLALDEGEQQAFPLALERMSFQQGGGEATAQQLTLSRYQEGQVRVASDWILADASTFPFLKCDLQGLGSDATLFFFWRTTEDPDRLQRVRIARLWEDSSLTLNLGHHDAWQGTVLQIGFELEDQAERPLHILSPRLHSSNRSDWLLAMLSQLGQHETWGMRATHFLLGAMWKEDAILVPMLMAWVAYSLVFYLLLGVLVFRSRPQAAHLGIVFMLAWLVFDGLWLAQHFVETRNSYQRFAGKSADEAAAAALDGSVYRFAQDIRQQLLQDLGTTQAQADGNPSYPRLFIVGDNSKVYYWRLRLQYHLWPFNVFNHDQQPRASYVGKADYLILVGSIPGLGYKAQSKTLEWGSPRQSLPVEPLAGNSLGVLFRLDSQRSLAGSDDPGQ